MRIYSIAAIVIISLLVLFDEAHCSLDSRPQSDSLTDFRQLLQEFNGFSPDACGPPYGRKQDWRSGQVESRLLSLAADMVTKELNGGSGAATSPRERAEERLRDLEQFSATINGDWPDENRLHFEVLDLPPVLVVKASIRTHETFLVFGVPETDGGKPNTQWRAVGSNTDYVANETPYSRLRLYPLHRGPSGRARFLTAFDRGGCAGAIGVAYDVREWDPSGYGNLAQVIDQAGAFGLDDKVPGFPHVGKLQTQGSQITLPYCWFSAIDTWDNPSLCSVDTYDVSGDNVRFLSRAYNRPDLVPIAKVLKYAMQRDYQAVRGYCASRQVAHKLVRNLLPHVFADDVRVSRRGKGMVHVELGYWPSYSFDVQEFSGQWRVVAFSIK